MNISMVNSGNCQRKSESDIIIFITGLDSDSYNPIVIQSSSFFKVQRLCFQTAECRSHTVSLGLVVSQMVTKYKGTNSLRTTASVQTLQ